MGIYERVHMKAIGKKIRILLSSHENERKWKLSGLHRFSIELVFKD